MRRSTRSKLLLGNSIFGYSLPAGGAAGGGGTTMGAGSAAAAAAKIALWALTPICGRRGPPSPGLAGRIGEGFFTPAELTVSYQSIDKRVLRENKV